MGTAQIEWKKRNPEKVAAQKHRHYMRHREAIMERVARWISNNKERHAKYARKWDVEHPEIMRAASRKYRQANRDLVLQRLREWYYSNPERAGEITKRSQRKHRRDLDDCYVITCLLRRTRLTVDDLPKMLIEAKREEIKLKRLVRNGDYCKT